MGYNGTIELIAGVKPANNGNFPMVNAKDVYVDDDTRLDAKLNGLDDSIDDLNAAVVTDATLSQTGKPADAKAVGDAINNITIEVDATLSQTGKAADAKATGDAVSDLKTQINNISKKYNFDTSTLETISYILLGSGKWGPLQGTARASVFEIPENTIAVEFTYTGETQGYIAFFNTFSEAVSDETPDYSAGYTGRIGILPAETRKFIIDSDMNYIYIQRIGITGNPVALTVNFITVVTDETLTKENIPAEAKATGNKIQFLNENSMRLMTDDEVNALTSIMDVPPNRYFTTTGAKLIDELISNPPEGISRSNSYMIFVWKYGSRFKSCEIRRSSNSESYFGVTYFNHDDSYEWFDRSFATVANKSLTSSEKAALLNSGDLLTMPYPAFVWVTKAQLQELLGNEFPFEINDSSHLIRCWNYAAVYRQFDITGHNGNDHFVGYNYAAKPDPITWKDFSRKTLTEPIEENSNAISSIENNTCEEFIISNFETTPYWWLGGGRTASSGVTVRTTPIAVKPGKTYYSGWTIEGGKAGHPACKGVWLDKNKNWLSDIFVISPYRETSGVSRLYYNKDSVIIKDGVYYKAKEEIGKTAWDASKWDVIEKPIGCAEIVEYPVPEAGQAVVHRYTDVTNTGILYANLYSLTAPDNAYYVSLNVVKTETNDAYVNFDPHDVQYISTLPLFAYTGTPNKFWSKYDAEHATWQNKKLLTIGQSSFMVGRALRLLPFNTSPDAKYMPLVGFQEYLIPYFESVTAYGFSSQNYMPGVGDNEGKTIYDNIITAEKDLSEFDFFLLGLGGNLLTYTDDENNNIGKYNSTDVTTMCGGLNAMIDYILDQTKEKEEAPRIFILSMPAQNQGSARNSYMNNEAKKLSDYRKVGFIDLAYNMCMANSSDGTIFMPERYYYDGTHMNNYGQKIRGSIILDGLRNQYTKY